MAKARCCLIGARNVVLPRGNFHDARVAADPPQIARCGTCTTLPRRLPDRRDHRSASARRAPLHFLPDDRAERQHPAGIAAVPWRSDLWLRRLPRSLPLESVCEAFARNRLCGAAGGYPPGLRDFLALDETGFRELFRGSPIRRIKRRGLLRNVCVALGNVGTERTCPRWRLRRRIRNHSSPNTRPGHWNKLRSARRAPSLRSERPGAQTEIGLTAAGKICNQPRTRDKLSVTI